MLIQIILLENKRSKNLYNTALLVDAHKNFPIALFAYNQKLFALTFCKAEAWLCQIEMAVDY